MKSAASLGSGEAYAVGLDLGGTTIKSVSMRLPDGACLHRATAPTRDGKTENGQPEFVAQARRLLGEHEKGLGAAARHAGVSAPGLADRAATAICFMPGRLSGLEGLVWRDALRRDDRVPVLNDAHAALLGEIWQGAARGATDVVMLTLGTGVGGAIVSGGRLLTGRLGRAGHLGHLSVDFRGPPDICGTPGSIEDAIGDATVARRSGGRFLSTEALVEAAREGDREAREVWETSLRALAAALVSIVNALDPELIVIGGGIASAGPELFEPLGRLVAEREWRPAGARVRLVPAVLGAWAGAIGAAYHSWSEAKSLDDSPGLS